MPLCVSIKVMSVEMVTGPWLTSTVLLVRPLKVTLVSSGAVVSDA